MDRLPFPGGQTSGSGVGHFRVSIHVGRRGGGVSASCLSKRSSIPDPCTRGCRVTCSSAWGVTAEEQWPFELANGREVRYPVAWAQIRIGGREQPTIVVFGAPGSEPILGVVTLEEFLLAADPVHRRLIPVPGLLKRAWGAADPSLARVRALAQDDNSARLR